LSVAVLIVNFQVYDDLDRLLSTLAPIAAAGLRALGEWRTRRALRAAKAAPAPGARS
jgi:hypothetical protein